MGKTAATQSPSVRKKTALVVLKGLIQEIEKSQTIDDFFLLTCKAESRLGTEKEEELRRIADSTLPQEWLIATFTNQIFQKAVKTAIETPENTSNPEVLNAKKLIRVCLFLGGYILAYSFKSFSQKNTQNLRNSLKFSIRKIKSSLENRFDTPEICNCLYTIEANSDYNYRGKFSGKMKADSFFLHQSIARLLIGFMLHTIQGVSLLSLRFKQANKLAQTSERGAGLEAITLARRAIESYDKGLNYFLTKMGAHNLKSEAETFLGNFLYINEHHICSILKIFLISKSETITNTELVKFYLENASGVRNSLAEYAKKNFQAYRGEISEDHKEWTNKAYLITYKTACVLETANEAKDPIWKSDVAMFEIRNWINQIHQAINKSDIEDDWDKIEKFLKEENNRVEWKSSFYFSVEGPYINDEIDRSAAKQTLQVIARTVLGMMNTEGGTILVGVVENPEKIIREDIRNNLLSRQSTTFFDVQWELDKFDKKLDNLKQHLLDALKDSTLLSADYFNGLWSIEPIIIKDAERAIMICKINIAVAPEPLFSAKGEAGSISISMLKRANGRTIQVDPRPYIKAQR